MTCSETARKTEPRLTALRDKLSTLIKPGSCPETQHDATSLKRLRLAPRKSDVRMRERSVYPVAPHSDAEASGTRRIGVRRYGRLRTLSLRTA